MTLLEAVAAELAGEPYLWWGHTPEYGWVVLDRQDARHDDDSRHLIRCRDWSLFEVSRADFSSNRFAGFKMYIGTLPDAQAQDACNQLLVLRREFASRMGGFRVTKAELERRRKEEKRQAVVEAHRRFLEQYGLPDQQVRLPSGRPHRVTHCYNCKRHLDNAVDLECVACEWIICPCGACGCGAQ